MDSILKNIKNHADKLPVKSEQVPMLLIPNEENNAYTMYNVITQSLSESKFVVPYYKRFAGSSHGWLVAVEEDYTVTLYKPYSTTWGTCSNVNLSIRLPPFDFPDPVCRDVFDYHIKKATFSVDPFINPDECIVAVIFTHDENLRKVGFIRPGKDTTWTLVDCRKSKLEDILYYNGQFYGLNPDGSLFSFEITESFSINFSLLAYKIPYNISGNNYLVESQGKLLQVSRCVRWDLTCDDLQVTRRRTQYVYVYKLDFDKQEWVEIKSLGGAALFMGDNTSISVLASDFPGCKPNCLYFTHDDDDLCSSRDVQNDLGIYNLESGKMEFNFGLHTRTLAQMRGRVLIWV